LVVKSILDEMAKCLSEGDRIEIRGFGSFEINQRNARIARNPRTGEKVLVPEKPVPHFKAGLELRLRVDPSTAKSR
jgi:integration host factor subunit beta